MFAVPEGALPFWAERFAELGIDGVKADEAFGERRLHFAGPDGDGFALVEAKADRAPRPGRRAASTPRRRSAASTPPRCACATTAPPPNC